MRQQSIRPSKLCWHIIKATVTVLRPRAILGVGDSVVFPRILRAHKEGRLRVIGKADNEIDFTSIKNLCRAVELCIEKKENSTSTNLQCNK